MDPQLVALFVDRLSVWRPVVDLSTDAAPMTAIYEQLHDDVACAIQPRPGRVVDLISGPVAGDPVVIYVATGLVSPGDRVAQAHASSVLAAPAAVGALVLELQDPQDAGAGSWVMIGSADQAELCPVAHVAGTSVALASGTRLGHTEGDRVALVRVLEVTSAADEAGRGHHTRAEARAVGS